MPEDESPAALFALLDDEYARAILQATNNQAMSAHDLAEAIDASPPTVYRRIERLQAHDLLAESTELDEAGHHRSRYRARLDEIVIELTGDRFEVRVRREHPADRLTDLWEGL